MPSPPTFADLVGKTVTLPGVHFPAQRDKLVLAVSTSCHFCNDSLPFYRYLTSKLQGKLDIVAVCPQAQADAESYYQTSAGIVVPRHVTIHGIGLRDSMLSATVAITPLAPSSHTIVQVAAEPADPGSTLKPIDPASMDNSGARPVHFQVPPLIPDRYPNGVEIDAISVVDREGLPRDIEISAIRNNGQPFDEQANGVILEIARETIAALQKNRYHPALIDGKPCQTYFALTMASRPG